MLNQEEINVRCLENKDETQHFYLQAYFGSQFLFFAKFPTALFTVFFFFSGRELSFLRVVEILIMRSIRILRGVGSISENPLAMCSNRWHDTS